MSEIHNRFNPKDNWSSIDFVGGRRLQTSELNEIQAMSLHRDKSFGDVIFGEGNIISGGELFINRETKQIKISNSRVYYGGFIYDVNETTLQLTGVGDEVIGFKVEYEVLTYEAEIGLCDPAIGFSNYGMPGANRTIATPKWVVDDPNSIIVHRFNDGVLENTSRPPEYDGFAPLLARRTYDTNGSFLVSGMDGFIEPRTETDVTLVIEAGKAYVLGYEISLSVPRKLKLPKSIEYRPVVNETKMYLSGTNRYNLNSTPVKEITLLTAVVELTETITRGNVTGTSDALPKQPVVDIVEVKQGGTTYQKGIDYQLIGNTIDWSLSGQEPAGGTSYSVKYRYTKTMIPNVDYRLDNNAIEFLSGDKPVANTTFQTSYTFYLARKDIYFLTHQGNIQIISGQPDVNPFAPSSPPDVLELGELYLPPNSDEVVVTNKKPKRLTMLEIRSMLDRLERAEYNQALQNLDGQTQSSDPLTVKKGIFSDNFTNYERSDVSHPDFDAMLDPKRKELILPYDQSYVELLVDKENSTVRFHERIITMDYEEVPYVEQPFATESMNVNPYMVFGNLATIRLTPSSDSWVEESLVTKTVNEWWDNWWTEERTETNVILEENIQHIRQRDIEVVGEGFEPVSDNIKATFDGVEVDLVPLEGSYSGTERGTMKADGYGKFRCKFTIPQGIRCGTREVRFYNEKE